MISTFLSKKVYSKENIIQVISVFRNYAKIKFDDEKDYFVLSFEKCKYDEKKTTMEFENYLIGMENSAL